MCALAVSKLGDIGSWIRPLGINFWIFKVLGTQAKIVGKFRHNLMAKTWPYKLLKIEVFLSFSTQVQKIRKRCNFEQPSARSTFISKNNKKCKLHKQTMELFYDYKNGKIVFLFERITMRPATLFLIFLNEKMRSEFDYSVESDVIWKRGKCWKCQFIVSPEFFWWNFSLFFFCEYRDFYLTERKLIGNSWIF